MAERQSFEETHEKILRGALEEFSDKGYSAATIKDISRRAGCNSVTIFRHFADKQTLFQRVVERFRTLELDEEALQQAIQALARLTEGDRLVGIISHVAELRERIDKQIVVTKGKCGGSGAAILTP